MSAGRTRPAATSSGLSTSPAAVPFLSVQDFYNLPDWQSILFVRGSDDPVLAYKSHYWEQPAFHGLTLPNPYHDSEGFKRAWHNQQRLPAPARDPIAEALEADRPFSFLPGQGEAA